MLIIEDIVVFVPIRLLFLLLNFWPLLQVLDLGILSRVRLVLVYDDLGVVPGHLVHLLSTAGYGKHPQKKLLSNAFSTGE